MGIGTIFEDNYIQSCSSRSTPKPQQPSSTMRPNMTFHTYACPPEYAAWYCLNGATCFSLTLAESILYNCECADGYIGQRCEYKDLDQSYLPSRDQVIVETASIAGGITVAVLLIVIISISIAVYYRRRSKMKPAMMVEIREGDVELRPFRSRASFSSSIRMSSMVYSSNEPESGHKTISNSKIEQPNSTSA
ncbi:Protein spitz [Nymphon striatum]|nr:Protein spitz [Nymphon striatum]